LERRENKGTRNGGKQSKSREDEQQEGHSFTCFVAGPPGNEEGEGGAREECLADPWAGKTKNQDRNSLFGTLSYMLSLVVVLVTWLL
jgi:hypothetical protein